MSRYSEFKSFLKRVFVGTNDSIENEDFSGHDFKGKDFGERSYASAVLLAAAFPAGFYLGETTTGFPAFDVIIPALISMLASYLGFLTEVYRSPRAFPEAFSLIFIDSFFFVVLLSLVKKHFAHTPPTFVVTIFATAMFLHLSFTLTPAFKKHSGRPIARNSRFIRADLSSSEWINAWIGNCDFTSANIFAAKFTKSTISKCRFNLSTMHMVKIVETTIENAVFDNSEATNASFQASTIVNSSFDQCNLSYANFENCKIQNTTFRGALLGSTNFSKATFSGVDLTGATASQHTKWPKGFDPIAANLVVEITKVPSATSL